MQTIAWTNLNEKMLEPWQAAFVVAAPMTVATSTANPNPMCDSSTAEDVGADILPGTHLPISMRWFCASRIS